MKTILFTICLVAILLNTQQSNQTLQTISGYDISPIQSAIFVSEHQRQFQTTLTQSSTTTRITTTTEQPITTIIITSTTTTTERPTPTTTRPSVLTKSISLVLIITAIFLSIIVTSTLIYYLCCFKSASQTAIAIKSYGQKTPNKLFLVKAIDFKEKPILEKKLHSSQSDLDVVTVASQIDSRKQSLKGFVNKNQINISFEPNLQQNLGNRALLNCQHKLNLQKHISPH